MAGKKKRLNKKEMAYFKQKLLDEKKRVLQEITGMGESSSENNASDQSGEISKYSNHLGDVAALSYDREFAMGLSERTQKYLEQIDDALERIDNGTYGICLVTKELIPLERLEEVPIAKYSVEGKNILSKR